MATDGGVGEAITGTGCAIAVLQNSAASYKGSFLDLSKHRNSEATETERKTWVEKISEPIISLPTKGLQLITGHYQDNPNSHLAEFASSVDEISRRPLFQGNFFTTIVNLGLIGSAVGDLFEENYHDAFQKTAAVVLWSVGNFFSGASLQEDSQKHFFSTLGKRPAKKFET